MKFKRIIAALAVTGAALVSSVVVAAPAQAIQNDVWNNGSVSLQMRNAVGQWTVAPGYRLSGVTGVLVPSGRCLKIDAAGTANDRTTCAPRVAWTSVPAGTVYVRLL